MDTQLRLDLTSRRAPGRGEFFVTEANALALAMLDTWRTWPQGKMVLCGPGGSGKTHLACVWVDEAGAQCLSAEDVLTLDEAAFPEWTQTPLCIEDVDQLAGVAEAERRLFHLHNLAQSNRQALLVTGRTAPAQWPIQLPDLRSRLEAAQVASLNEPDDQLLSVVLAKLFAERQTVPAQGVIPYLVARMPRSFEMAKRVVLDLDDRALGTKKGATLAKAREVLEALDQTDLDV